MAQKKKPTKKKKTTLLIPAQIHAKLVRQGEREQRSFNSICVRAFEMYLRLGRR